MKHGTILIALVALAGCRQATPAQVGEQSVRDAQGMAVIRSSEHAGQVSPDVVPEASKGGAVQQAPSRVR